MVGWWPYETCLCLAASLSCLDLYASEGTPPAATGQAPRFQVVSGQVEYARDDLHPTFIRLDTWTGEACFINQVPVGVGNMVTPFWQPIPEMDSPRIRALMK